MIDFSKIGVSILDAEPDAYSIEAMRYLTTRGIDRKSIRAANIRFLTGPAIDRLFPASKQGDREDHASVRGETHFYAKWALVVPDSRDKTYGTGRFEYNDLSFGVEASPPKFLTPAGRPLKVYHPKTVPAKSLIDTAKPLYIIEGPTKAIAAAQRGLACVGVNGCAGWHEPETKLPKGATVEQARATIRAELHQYLLPGREVCLLTDADARTNLNVRQQLINFMDAAAIGFSCKVVYVELPISTNGPGIDDYFADGNTLADFKQLPRHPRGSEVIKLMRCAFMDRTELGLADRFATVHGDQCRHDPRIGEWFTYADGEGYLSGDVEPRRRLVDVVRTLPSETEASRGDFAFKERRKFQDTCGRSSTINAALALAANDRSLEVDAAKFDADTNLLGLQNGILNLSTGKLLAPSRDLLVTRKAGCTFEAKASSPEFVEFMRTVTGGDTALLSYLQEVVGAALLGRAIRTAIQIFYGPGGTGKTTLIEIILALLGEYATATKADLLLRQRRHNDPEAPTPFLKVLRGLRLVVCSELNENVAIDEALVKDLTGADTITARGLREAPITFKNTAAIWIRGNHAPVINAADSAIRERVNIVPFNNVIDASDRNKTLAEDIVAKELPGVLNWALAGMRRYASRGYEFVMPESVKKATIKVQIASDIIGAWLDECCDVKPTQSDYPYCEPQTEVTHSYRRWCMQNGHQPMSSKMLWAKLRNRFGFDDEWPRKSNGIKVAYGLQLTRTDDINDPIHTANKELKSLAVENVELRRELAALVTPGLVAPVPKAPRDRRDQSGEVLVFQRRRTTS
jgi:P4 family phage/plasmid primase-like protien